MNSTLIIRELSQLNHLLDEQKFADYWRTGTELIRKATQAQAARIHFFESLRFLDDKVLSTGEVPEPIRAIIEEKESVVAAEPIPHSSRTSEWGGYRILYIPLIAGRIVRGLFSLVFPPSHTEPLEFSAIQDLTQFIASSALRSSYLLDAQERFERVNLLYMITQDLTSTLELPAVLSQTTYMAASVLDAQASTLYRIDPHTNELVFMITKGEAAHILEEKRMPIGQGVAGWVAVNGKSLIVNDPAQSTLFDSSVDSQTGFTTSNILCVPLRIQKRTVGVLEVMNKEEGDGFTEEDKDWLSVIGRQVAISLENAHLFTREQEKVGELATLNEVSQTINSELDVSAILDKITLCILDILPAERSELLLAGPDERQLQLRSSAGYGADDDISTRYIELDEKLESWCAKFSAAYEAGHLMGDLPVVPWANLPELQQSSAVIVPLTHRERIIGVIVVYSLSRHYFDEEKRNLLQTFANQAAVAIQNAALYQNLRNEQERIIKAQEEVRHQLARDLHDNTAQMLSLIIMNLDMARQSLQKKNIEKSLSEIDRMEEIARQTNREVRTLLFELRPIILESRGLIPALDAYHRQLNNTLEGTLHLDASPLGFQIELNGASTIFSIIQEAVNNIRKHANAGNIWIRVYTDAEYLHFEVEDDGLGFDLQETTSGYDTAGSFGLLNMRERASMLNGKLEVLSPRPAAASGTLVRGSVPLVKIVCQDIDYDEQIQNALRTMNDDEDE